MESLQQVWIDLIGRFRNLPRATQVLVAAAGVFCALMIAVFGSSSTTRDRVDLLPQALLNPRQLPAYEMAFAEAGLNDYSIEQQKVLVPAEKKSQYIAALATAKLINTTSGKMVEEALDASSPFENQQQRTHRIKIARQRELAQRISQFKGIEEATVEYDSVEKKGIRRQVVCTASVTVRATHNQRLSIAQAQTIRKYLAGCIAGLDPENVYIVDLNLALLPSAVPEQQETAGQNLTPYGTGKSNQHQATHSPKESAPLPTGTIVILGSALIAGCVALWKRKQDATDSASVPTHSFEMDITPSEDLSGVDKVSEEPIPPLVGDEPCESTSPPAEAADHRISKGRLLLAGQSDYSHLVPDQQTDGIELTTLTLDSSDGELSDEDSPSASKNQPFAFAHHADPADLFETIKDESPQIIATVFSNLGPDRAASVLNRLSHKTQLEVLRHLGDLNAPDENLTREIGKTLADRLQSVESQNENRKAGLQAVRELLQHVDQTQCDALLDDLRGEDSAFAEQLHVSSERTDHYQQNPSTAVVHRQPTKAPPTYREQQQSPPHMLCLSGEALCQVFAAADPRDAIIALSNWDSQITERLISDMHPEESLRLREKLHRLQKPPQHEVSASCERIYEIVLRLEKSGKIRFG